MNAMEILRRALEREIARRGEAMTKLAGQIVEDGIGDRLGWLEHPMKADAEGLLAKEVLDGLERLTVAEIRDKLADRFQREVSYLMPSNNDNAFRIYQIQALQKMAEMLSHVAADLEKEDA